MQIKKKKERDIQRGQGGKKTNIQTGNATLKEREREENKTM